MVTKITNTLTSRKFKLAMIRIGIIACTIAMTMCNVMVAFADDETGGGGGENANSDITNTSTMNSMVGIVFWALRILILLIGGVPGTIKVVQGQADENPRDRNAGLASIGIAGAAFAASFVIEKLI